MDEILTAEQVAQVLKIHQFTVLKFIKQGKLKASKLGRVYRIRRADVEKFLDDQTEKVEKKEVPVKKNTKKVTGKAINTANPKESNEKKSPPPVIIPKTINPTPNSPSEDLKQNSPDHYILELKI